MERREPKITITFDEYGDIISVRYPGRNDKEYGPTGRLTDPTPKEFVRAPKEEWRELRLDVIPYRGRDGRLAKCWHSWCTCQIYCHEVMGFKEMNE